MSGIHGIFMGANALSTTGWTAVGTDTATGTGPWSLSLSVNAGDVIYVAAISEDTNVAYPLAFDPPDSAGVPIRINTYRDPEPASASTTLAEWLVLARSSGTYSIELTDDYNVSIDNAVAVATAFRRTGLGGNKLVFHRQATLLKNESGTSRVVTDFTGLMENITTNFPEGSLAIGTIGAGNTTSATQGSMSIAFATEGTLDLGEVFAEDGTNGGAIFVEAKQLSTDVPMTEDVTYTFSYTAADTTPAFTSLNVVSLWTPPNSALLTTTITSEGNEGNYSYYTYSYVASAKSGGYDSTGVDGSYFDDTVFGANWGQTQSDDTYGSMASTTFTDHGSTSRTIVGLSWVLGTTADTVGTHAAQPYSGVALSLSGTVANTDTTFKYIRLGGLLLKRSDAQYITRDSNSHWAWDSTYYVSPEAHGSAAEDSVIDVEIY